MVKRKNKDGNRLCSTCNPYSKTVSLYDERRPEIKVGKALSECFPEETFPVGTYACFRSCDDTRKPDIILNFKEFRHMFNVEVDENNGHQNYETTCEWAKVLNHCQSMLQTDNTTKATTIRLNSSTWKVNGETVSIPLDKRIMALIDCIKHQLTTQKDQIEIIHLYYNDHEIRSTSQEDIEKWISELRVDFM